MNCADTDSDVTVALVPVVSVFEANDFSVHINLYW